MKGIKDKNGIAMFVVIVLIFVYIGYQCYTVTHIGLQTQTAVTTTVYESIDAQALIIRDEHAIEKNGSAITVPSLNDGDKINTGGTVAYTFDSSESANSYARYNEIMEQLEYYDSLESQTVGQAANVESINKQIDINVDNYIRSLYNNENVDDASQQINGALVQRQLIIGEKVDFSSITQELRKEAESYASATKTAGFVTTDKSGVFSSYTDGYENIVPYDKACDQTIDSIKEAIGKVDKSADKKTNNIGKLITSYNWYIEMVVPAEKVVSLSNGEYVAISLKNNGARTLNAKIVDGAEPDMGVKETLLVLQCNDMNADLASLRVEQIEIRCKKYEGVKVPMEALHVVDGKKGVFALISSQVRFRTADVIYSDDDWVLLSYDKESKDGIRLYDKIIIQGKDLEDGKVYT